MNIRRTDLVLEVGSGNSPRSRTDLMTDRLVYDNSQRAGTFTIVVDRRFVVADGFNLPFKDKAFDYVICSHVLEHLDDPISFSKELMRVAKRGYIEVPNIYGERLFGWGFHLWHSEIKHGKLIMTAKKHAEMYGGFFHRLIAHNISFRRFCEEQDAEMYIKYEWNTKIPLTVVSTPKTDRYIQKIDQEAFAILSTWKSNLVKDVSFWILWMFRRFIKKTQKLLRRFMWKYQIAFQRNQLIESLLPLFRCPSCHTEVITQADKGIRCVNCKSIYRLDGIIPVMLTREEAKKGY